MEDKPGKAAQALKVFVAVQSSLGRPASEFVPGLYQKGPYFVIKLILFLTALKTFSYSFGR
jgi:hypothetical protein